MIGRKKKLENINKKIDNPILPFSFQIYSKNKKGAQDMYKLLNKNNECPSGKTFWNKTYNFNDNQWKQKFWEPFKILKDSKMQWFQSRINHNILATNTFLYKIKVTNKSNCTFCLSADETIKHLLWECERVQCFLKEVTTWLSQNNIYIVFDEKSFLFNIIQ